ncbi:hypothetical protein P168DRAFT_246742 [Aspergillus campestris IBT 28561]|uniref:DNA replication regulator SLD2 n=1 Tax=Aspergillus campestris (strain IBT 28561) TaxID=1392248 RepID=A0A2I1DEK6_ASPC2|nr:uncharacterized protein P168DRAFT_246742 [Aspergillus campestris IBT 28561]PKY08294.1 hypothetical protein P168DRAFT_246742 [Aspergillus campestris IBT 28561]
MASVAIPDIVSQSTDLRAELKEWERTFAAANGGRKADRGDIKKVPEIAAKYKQYSRLKSLETSADPDKQSHQPAERENPPKKRKHASPTGPEVTTSISTPRKTNKGGAFTTPSKTRLNTTHPAEVDPYDSPSTLRRLFSPTTHMQPSPLKSTIGPTPQRDGKALGLFDLLSESGGSTATPTATRLATVRGADAQTPSKRRKLDTIAEEDEEEDEEDTSRLERTPVSSGKKYMLANLFATPITLRYASMVEDGDGGAAAAGGNDALANSAEDDSTHQPAGSDTPSFLRRSNPGRPHVGGSGSGLSPIAVRKRPQFVGKGLSALVQGLRDMEEERMQDDMDVLDEIEAEQYAAMMGEEEAAGVTDSQANPTEPFRRPYKKKGQKRTTRRVNMRPVLSKPKTKSSSPVSDLGADDDDDEEEQEDHTGENEPAAVPETQYQSHAPANEDGADGFDDDDDADSLHTMSEPDMDSDDPEYDESEDRPSLTRGKSFSEKMREAIAESKPQSNEPPQTKEAKAPRAQKPKESKKPAPRKIDPQAHANYRSLKMRNKNTKGRGRGRFRR